MARLHLIRHGQAAAGWDVDPDPGLDDLGRAQAAAAAAAMVPFGPMPLLCSPLRRTRETAAPLAQAWGVAPAIEPRVGEIQSPTDDLAERGAWLRGALAGSWADLGREHHIWRGALLACLGDLEQETTVVTHFVAINAVLGAALGDDRLIVRSVANASTTVVDHQGDRIVLVGEPGEAPTMVL